ncbi:MAG: sulfatase-like hydrolase/transferase, partial [Actinomycetota bacterium]
PHTVPHPHGGEPKIVKSKSRILLAFSLVAASSAAGLRQPTHAAQFGERPNILVIVTDDQRGLDTMEWMPKTVGWFGAEGTRFPNAYATTPICCPSRATIFSGRFVHNHGVRKNTQAPNLDQTTTVQRYLDQAGYRTAMAGKFLNFWPIENAPPYFDQYYMLEPRGDTYYGNTFNQNGVVGPVADYSTDVIRDRAKTLIETDFDGDDDDPWFLYVAPFAPHAPAEPAERHEDADVGKWNGNPAVFETNKRDKPDFIRRAFHTLEEARGIRTSQLRSLLAVDELVDEVFQTLEAEGEENTLALFLSDNGFFWAEHGLTTKNQAYPASVLIPLFARWPGHIPAGRSDGRLVGNLDVAPTIMEAAGLTPDPAIPMDGQSVLGPHQRTMMLAEAWTSGSRGPYASTITQAYQFIEYYTNDGRRVKYREYYDMVRDPWQLRNLLGDRKQRNDPYVGALHAQLAPARVCRGHTGPVGCSAALTQIPIPRLCPSRQKVRGRHLVGSTGRDAIPGGRGRDVACAREGKDRVRGARKNDMLIGGPGRDVLVGGPGNDVLLGQSGRDLCTGGPGRDRYRGCEVRREPGRGRAKGR